MSKSNSSESVQLITIGDRQYNVYIVPVNYDLAHKAQIEEPKFDWITDYDSNLILRNPTEHLYPLPAGKITQRIMLVYLNHLWKVYLQGLRQLHR